MIIFAPSLGGHYLSKRTRFCRTQAMNHARQARQRQRPGIPQLEWSQDRGWHINFANALGKSDRHRFEIPKDSNKHNETRAKNQWRLSVVRKIPGAAKLPEFADLAELAQGTAGWAGSGQASDGPNSLAIMPLLSYHRRP